MTNMACNGSAIMTAMKQSRPKLKRLGRWLAPAALLTVAPKCALCLLAYAGLGAALGLGGPEICGAQSGPAGMWAWPLLGGAGLAPLASYFLATRTTPNRT